MKKYLLLIIGVFFLISFTKLEAKKTTPFGITFEFFYHSLNNYGMWMELGTGVYAWKPSRVTYGWKPYSSGRWCWTSQGWYWDSYEPYGWAVYHYGRWFYDDYYGWIWIPDSQWGPAWVEWRYDDDYIGWAPLPPYAVFNNSFGISYSRNWNSPFYYWNFVKYKHFHHHNVYNYYINDNYKKRIHSTSKYRNNYGYESGNVINNGIDRDFIERKIGDRIPETRTNSTSRLRDVSSERTRDAVNIYRPSQEEVEKVRVRDFNIQRSDRSTSLDLNKVERSNIRIQENRRVDNESNIRREETRENRIENRGDDRSSRILNPNQRENNESMDRTNRNEIKREEPKTFQERYDSERSRQENRIQQEQKRENDNSRYNRQEEKPKYDFTPKIQQRPNNDNQPRIERRNDEPRQRQRESSPEAPSSDERSRRR